MTQPGSGKTYVGTSPTNKEYFDLFVQVSSLIFQYQKEGGELTIPDRLREIHRDSHAVVKTILKRYWDK